MFICEKIVFITCVAVVVTIPTAANVCVFFFCPSRVARFIFFSAFLSAPHSLDANVPNQRFPPRHVRRCRPQCRAVPSANKKRPMKTISVLSGHWITRDRTAVLQFLFFFPLFIAWPRRTGMIGGGSLGRFGLPLFKTKKAYITTKILKCQIYCRNSSLGDKVLLRRGGRRVKEALEEKKKMHAPIATWATGLGRCVVVFVPQVYVCVCCACKLSPNVRGSSVLVLFLRSWHVPHPISHPNMQGFVDSFLFSTRNSLPVFPVVSPSFEAEQVLAG